MQKVGFSSLDFSDSRNKIKEKLPVFYTHVREMFSKFLRNVEKHEIPDFDMSDPDVLLETQLPEDIASIMHQELEFYSQNITGEIFANIFAIWKEELQIFAFSSISKLKKSEGQNLIPFIVSNYLFDVFINL